MTSPTSKFTALLTGMISGLQSSLPATVNSFPLVGQMMTVPQALQTPQAFVTSTAAVAAKQAAYKQAVVARRAQEVQIRLLLAGLVAAMRQLFAGNVEMLAKFGVVSKPKAVPTTATKAAAAKRKAISDRKKASVAGSATVAVAPAPVVA